MEYNHSKHAVWKCTYHLVFVTKFRKPVISHEIGDFMKGEIARLAKGLGGELLSAETDRDHLHLLVSLPPDVKVSSAVISFKTQMSKLVHQNEEFMQHVRKYHKGKCPFWTKSYFVATTGSVSMETVKEYIESQRTEEHQRKYAKRNR